MYAFWPESFRGTSRYSRKVDAVWFKRKNGLLTAAMGTYGLFFVGVGTEPTDDTYEGWVVAHEDNRYGPSCRARWNGTKFWSTSEGPVENGARLDFLTGMLAGFPDPPAGWDGWWTF
jgi:hypothetical protein